MVRAERTIFHRHPKKKTIHWCNRKSEVEVWHPMNEKMFMKHLLCFWKRTIWSSSAVRAKPRQRITTWHCWAILLLQVELQLLRFLTLNRTWLAWRRNWFNTRGRMELIWPPIYIFRRAMTEPNLALPRYWPCFGCIQESSKIGKRWVRSREASIGLFWHIGRRQSTGPRKIGTSWTIFPCRSLEKVTTFTPMIPSSSKLCPVRRRRWNTWRIVAFVTPIDVPSVVIPTAVSWRRICCLAPAYLPQALAEVVHLIALLRPCCSNPKIKACGKHPTPILPWAHSCTLKNIRSRIAWESCCWFTENWTKIAGRTHSKVNAISRHWKRLASNHGFVCSLTNATSIEQENPSCTCRGNKKNGWRRWNDKYKPKHNFS